MEEMRRGLAALEHRGPDDAGIVFYDASGKTQPLLGKPAIDHVSLRLAPAGAVGSCRLSILDLSTAARQPMTPKNGRGFLVFNGEILNYIEVRKELSGLGHTFLSSGDTEVLFAAYQEWGIQCVTRFVGMFAFAVLELEKKSLTLARDFFGIKPLFYSSTRDGFAFSSQVASLFELAAIPRRANPARLHEFLTTGWVDHGSDSLFEGVQQIAPGHYLTVDLESLKVSEQIQYWDLPARRDSALTLDQAAEKLRGLMLDSVRMHLRSDAPLGAALSGGLDSSSIVGCMREVQGADVPIHAFTFVASSAGESLAWSEEPWADKVSASVNAIPHKVHAEPKRLAEDFERFLFLQDAPCWSPVVWAQQQIFRAAHEQGFKAMLSGQGSDEIFAGYNRHIASRIGSLVKRGALSQAFDLLNRAAELPDVSRVGIFHSVLAQTLPASVKSQIRKLRGSSGPAWLNHEWFVARNGHAPTNAPISRDVLHSVLIKDVKCSPLPALLRYEDRNAMAYSIDNRLPYLTAQIAEFAFSLPEEFLVTPDAVCKYVLRAAMKGIVPEDNLHRKDKQGFPVPVSEWLFELEPWAKVRLIEAQQIKVLRPEVVKNTIEAFFDRREKLVGNAFLIWRWIFLAGWVNQFRVDLSD